MLFRSTSGKPGKLGFYGEGGVKFSIPVNATYNETGNYKTKGEYPAYPEAIRILELPELGYYSKENIDQTGVIDMRGVNMALYFSAGVNIPVGYYSNVNIGPEVTLGLSDIMHNINYYRDIFGYPYEHQPTKIKNFGIRISFAYKL